MNNVIKSRIDSRINANVKTSKYPMRLSKWLWSDQVEDYLQKWSELIGNGNTANFFSGVSNVGEERYDLDQELNANKLRDVLEMFKIHYPNKWNLTILDPIFTGSLNAYNPKSKIIQEYGKKFGYKNPGTFANIWQYNALRSTKYLMIVRRQNQTVNYPPELVDEIEYVIVRDHRPSVTYLELVWRKHNPDDYYDSINERFREFQEKQRKELGKVFKT